MARRPRDLDEPPLEFIEDGMTDRERSAALATWLDTFDGRPAVPVAVRAVDTLAELRAEGEV